MQEPNIDHDLLEYILTLLSIPEHGSMNTDNLHTAYGLIKFMDEMPGGFLIYKADIREEIIYANKALLRIFECTTLDEFKNLTGNSFQGVVHPEDLDEIEQSIQEQVANSQFDFDYVEYRIISKSGVIRWVEDYGHFIHSDTVGDIFYVFISDATEKRNRYQAFLYKQMQKEEELKNLIDFYDKERNTIYQEHLRRLEVIEGLSVNYDSILYANLDSDEILPYRLSDRTIRQFENTSQIRSFRWYTSDYIRTWVHPEDRELVTQATDPAYIVSQLSKHKTYYINYRVLFLNEVQYLQLRIVNVGNKEQISQIVMGYRRVDDEIRREMEQKQLLEEALNNANLAITAKNTFLSNMSHDMRTPLNAIFGFTSLAKSCAKTNDSVQDYLDRITDSSEQLLELIDKVLEIAWSEADDNHLAEAECSLWSIMQNVQNLLYADAAEKNITLSLNSAALTHPDVYSDPDKLERLLLCLAHNAVKYTPDGGRVDMNLIELECLPNDYAVYQFVVEDNGIGISQEFIDRIYEPFAREKNTTFSGVLGTGLGLTIAKNIVDIMGGKIEAASTVGSGSKFTITLRLKALNHSLPVSLNVEETIKKLMNHKILLVEDNEINLEIETAILQELGFLIDTAENGSVAVKMIEKASPGDYALILMDIQMPVMNGRQATRAIRKLKNKVLSRIPIIALSADAFESDKRKSIESGMDAHLPKPIDVPLLLETIAKTMHTHEILYGNILKQI